MKRDDILKDLPARVGRAVAHYWETRATQRDKQKQTGKADQGLRSAVTGGAQMDGFIDLFTELIVAAGIPASCVSSGRKTLNFRASSVPPRNGTCSSSARTRFSLPSKPSHRSGRPSATTSTIEPKRRWEAPSTFGPPTGNTPISQALNRFSATSSCWRTATHPTDPVKVQEPHFKVFPEFVGASYRRRYELFCRKLVLERHYTASAFITSTAEDGMQGRIRDAGGRPFH